MDGVALDPTVHHNIQQFLVLQLVSKGIHAKSGSNAMKSEIHDQVGYLLAEQGSLCTTTRSLD